MSSVSTVRDRIALPLAIALTLAGFLGVVPAPAADPATALAPGSLAPSSWAQDGTERWSDELVAAAQSRDIATLRRLLATAPSHLEDDDVARLQGRVTSLDRHRSRSSQANAEELAKRQADIQSNLKDAKLIDALVDAANVHELASQEQWAAFIATESYSQLEAKAAVDAQVAAAEGDLLYAQELTFRLKSLAEDRGDKERVKVLEAELREITSRVALIAKYAPHAFYDLRTRLLKRMEPGKAIEPYNELFADEWKEAIRDATPALLLRALRVAANSHITDTGWVPLIQGGLESMQSLAASGQLSETFPALNDPEKVAAFLSAIDRIAAREGSTFADARDAVVEILTANDRTIKLPEEVVVLEFGSGATSNLSEDFGDDYSDIIWPEQLRRFRQQMDGDFVGVGVLIRYDDKHEIMVVNPLEGSPAARAGVRPGDLIVNVNGESTAGWSLNKAVDHITGPAGKPVDLVLKREDVDEPVSVTLVRQSIPMQSVNGWWKSRLDEEGSPVWNWFVDPDAGIGYARVTSFNDDTVADFVKAVESMRAERPLRGLIVDLRGNPGGLLPAAAGFANLFVKRGPLVSIEDRAGKKVDELFANPSRARFAGLPLVVLVNGESASASEIVSGALQAYDAAIIVGTQTFGKGSVQTVQPVTDGSTAAAVKVTTQFYVLPPEPGAERGRWVHKRAGKEEWGVVPDVEVVLAPADSKAAGELRAKADFIDPGVLGELAEDTRPDVGDLVREGIDPQLEVAVLLLESRILAEAGSSRVAKR
ncbi:MAG: S41 family peptidase [Planctomycetota bacterium]|nr:S41 family peptidase [Planctomycetota bacterium]